VPAPFELDPFDNRAWIAVVPFHMTNVGPRGMPSLPWVSAFPELNVRTYVRVEDRPGVYFFSLDAGIAVAVRAAPWPLQPAEALIVRNTMAEISGIRLPDQPPLLPFAKRLDVVAWTPTGLR
jgi:uncharacterized protein YqjF (DUF2071 family)